MPVTQALPATELHIRARVACEEAAQRMARAKNALSRAAELTVGTTWTRARTSEAAELRVRLRKAEERSEHLERALASNRRIGMALGIVMRELRCTEEQAFHVLQRASMQRNVKLRDVAEEVILTGTT